MNSLSYFLWAADVLPRISGFVIFFGIVLILCGGIGLFFLSLYNQEMRGERKEHLQISSKGYLIAYLCIALITLVSALVPSRETIFLIAGSEAGEMVVNSEEGQAVIQDIREVIAIQLEKLKQ